MITAPESFKKDVKIWVDEAIWGHRFYNDQTPWLVLLEFLAVFRSRYSDGHALNEPRMGGAHEDLYYVPRLIPLRELIFGNPHIQHIDKSNSSNREKWSAWKEQVNDDSGYDFSFLQARFGEFSRLAHVVEYFQNTAVEPHRQRRWTSRFIFPYGPDCLYADLPGNPRNSPDRRFFARGGELLYLMLCRSGSGPDISELINKRLLLENNPWNRVVKALLPEDNRSDSREISSKIGYLPFAERVEYLELAQTWQQLLQLDLLGVALFDPLVRLSSLHMLLYMLRRAAEEIGHSAEPRFVLEIASPSKTTLFELSSENLSANRMASLRAVRSHVENVKNDQGWHDACSARVPADAVRTFLAKRFAWEPEDSIRIGGDQDTIFSELRSYAEERHQQHVAKVHSEWARQIGLSVSQRGVGTWYSPSDSLLKALVMCIVDDGREEYRRFLGKLYDRFRLVVAVPEAEKAFGSLPTDQHAFTQNAQRLEQRLRTLGLLRRLSDDCAYVVNPHFRGAHDTQ